MKIAIVPVSMMTQQLSLWKLEREVDEAGKRVENCIRGVKIASQSLINKQQQLFDAATRIETARANIRKTLAK